MPKQLCKCPRRFKSILITEDTVLEESCVEFIAVGASKTITITLPYIDSPPAKPGVPGFDYTLIITNLNNIINIVKAASGNTIGFVLPEIELPPNQSIVLKTLGNTWINIL